MHTNPTTIRLSTDRYARYEAEAKAKHLTLSSYLRQKLENSDDIGEEISGLHLAFEQVASLKGQSQSGGDTLDPGIFLETLLLLRMIAQPGKLQMAHAELRRLGYNVWEAKKRNES